MSYLKIGSSGAGITTVASSVDLPAAGATGLYLTIDTQALYWWNGSAWVITYGLLDDSAFTGTGIVARTASRTYAGRTITGTANRLSVTNGNGVSGNPTLNIDTSLLPSPVLADVAKFLVCTGANAAAWTALAASLVPTDVSTFANLLSAADDTVQKALATLDDVAADNIDVDASGFAGLLDATDTSVQDALETLDLTKLTYLVAETDATVATAGQIGETVSASESSPTGTGVGATGEWGDVCSISISEGDWRIEGVVGFKENGATLTGNLACGIATAAGNSAPALGARAIFPFMISGSDDAELATPFLVANFTGVNQTFYLKSRLTYSAGSPQHFGKITARRIG